MVRLSGAAAVSIGRTIFHSSPALGTRPRRVEYGAVRDRRGQRLDTALGWSLAAPRSYTGEDMVEITTHGSDLVLEGVLDAALAAGAVLAGPGEFTRRAFLSGRLDLVQAEAVIDVIQAGGRQGLEQAYGHLRGRLSREVDELVDLLTRVVAQIEAHLDFAEEDIEPRDRRGLVGDLDLFERRAGALLETFEGARRRLEGRLVTLIGQPNVGKSTLLNALLGEERAIVTAVPGTTRDLVEGRCVWSGNAVRLVDTAGLRSSPNAVEVEGVARARSSLAAADVVVAVLDRSQAWSPDDDLIVEAVAGRPTVWVLNKADLPGQMRVPETATDGAALLEVSALRGENLEALRLAVTGCWQTPGAAPEVALTRQRHHDLLAKARAGARLGRGALSGGEPEECAAAALHGALAALGALLGYHVDDGVLDRIFSEFCIGK